MSWHNEQLAAGYEDTAAAIEDPCVYRRGDVSEPMTAAIGMAKSQADDVGSIQFEQRVNELLIRPKYFCDLQRPQLNDEIVFDDSNRRFIVVADMATKVCWRYSDGGGTFFRVTVDELDPLPG